MRRIRQGWELTKKSWALLRGHPTLFRFPLYGSLAMLVVAVVPVGGVYLITSDDYGPGIPLVVVGAYLLSFVGIYFGVALAAAAARVFKGEPASVGDGLAVARGRIGPIAGWAGVSAAVGLVLGALENSGSAAEAIVSRLVSAAWGLITFLAVPVIAFEGTGPFETLKRSAGLFKERWGSQVTGNVAIGGLVGLLGILPAIVLAGVGIALLLNDSGGARALGAVLVAIGVLLFAISFLILQALRGVFGVALYEYAAEGEAPGPFTGEELHSVARPRTA